MASAAVAPPPSNLATSLRQADRNGTTTTTTRAVPAPAHTQTTFYRSASIVINESVGSMSMSPANRDVVLAARKGLYIVDLESPFAPPRFLAQLSTWEAADVQWSPHPARSHWVASTSNDRLLIWNLDRPEGAPRGPAPFLARGQSGTSLDPSMASMASLGSSPSLSQMPTSQTSSSPRSSAIEHVLQAHTRAITDINFSAHHPDILASCGIDAWSWVWDLRIPTKPVQGYSAWNASATQIKWNRSTPHRLATAVTNKVLIWDDRKGALPLATIEAHENHIYGLDWSRDISSAGSNRLVTCSLDGAVKFWDLGAPASQAAIGSRSLVTEPEQVIQTATPIWRARHLPFGRGVMTLPQRGDTTLSMWARDNAENGPVERFVGHKDIVKEYLFRTRGAQDGGRDDRRFQLVTWSKDQTLRLWPVSEASMKKVGHDSTKPIHVLQTRKGAKDVSYRDPPPLRRREPSAIEAAAAGSPGTSVTSGTTTTLHRSSIMPPTDVATGLLSARGAASARLGGTAATIAPVTTATSPSSARSTAHHSGFSNLHANTSSTNLLSASLQNRLNNLPASPSMLSKSFPKTLAGARASQARSHETTRKSTPGASFQPPTSAGPRAARSSATHHKQQERAKKRSKRLAQGAASTYMTRGAGPALGIGSDVLKIKLGGATLGGYQSQARRQNDAVTWISGVKVEKHANRRSKSVESPAGPTGVTPLTPTSPGGTRPYLGSRGISERLHVSRRADRSVSARRSAAGVESSGRDAPIDADTDANTDFDLQEEVIDVSKQVPQVVFEKIDIAKRSCTISLYGPWAHKQEPVFMRLSLRFSEQYPHEAPKFELQHNASCALQTRAFLLRSLSTILAECASQGQGCMEPCSLFLAGSETIELRDGLLLASQSVPFAEDDSSSDEEVNVAEGEVKSAALATPQMIRMLPGARCGASFGPNGQLVVFRSLKTVGTSSAARDISQSRDSALSPLPPLNLPLPASTPTAPAQPAESVASLTGTGSVKSAGTTDARPAAGGRFLYSYAELTKAMDSLTKLGSRRSEDNLHSSQAQLQAPELLSFMSSDFLARRLQARSSSSRTKRTNVLTSPLAFTSIEGSRQVATDAPPTPVRGRGRGTEPVKGGTGPRSRSLAIGRERHHAPSPLVPLATLAHPKAVSDVRIYSAIHVGDLTLRLARGGHGGDKESEDDNDDTHAAQLERPAFYRKRSESSPAAARVRLDER